MQWYHGESGRQEGPLTSDELKTLLASGRLGPATLVWREGMGDWLPVSQVPELAPASGAAPLPPMPAPPMPAAPAAAPTRERPWLLSILAVLWIVCGVIAVAAGCWLLLSGLGGENADEVQLAGGGLAVLGLLSLLAGMGTWVLSKAGWVLAVVMALLALPMVPFGTLFGIVLLAYLLSRGVRLLFSARPLEDLNGEEAQALGALPRSGLGVATGVMLLVAVLSNFVMLPLFAAIAIPNFLNAVQRGKQKRTMGDIRVVATAVESYAIDNNRYPAGDGPTVESIASYLEPTYVTTMPRVDGWGSPLQYEISPAQLEYRIESFAKDGVDSGPDVGTTTDFNHDIVFATGSFICYPDGTQR
jgi:type II secretory pathway pseudopilin PulG